MFSKSASMGRGRQAVEHHSYHSFAEGRIVRCGLDPVNGYKCRESCRCNDNRINSGLKTSMEKIPVLVFQHSIATNVTVPRFDT